MGDNNAMKLSESPIVRESAPARGHMPLFLVERAAGPGHGAAMTIPVSPLDDPVQAAYAWARYRRIMRAMAWVTLAVVLIAMAIVYRASGFVSINLYIATALGVGGTMLLASALMGLVFLSSGTGHDAAVIDFMAEDAPR